MKKIAVALLCAVVCVSSSSAFADTKKTHGEYGDHCAYGLTMGKAVPTDCHINWKSTDGKTYCFSTEEAKGNWAKDTAGNTKKANEHYAKIHTGHGTDEHHG